MDAVIAVLVFFAPNMLTPVIVASSEKPPSLSPLKLCALVPAHRRPNAIAGDGLTHGIFSDNRYKIPHLHNGLKCGLHKRGGEGGGGQGHQRSRGGRRRATLRRYRRRCWRRGAARTCGCWRRPVSRIRGGACSGAPPMGAPPASCPCCAASGTCGWELQAGPQKNIPL